MFLGQRATRDGYQRVYKQQLKGTGQRVRALLTLKFGEEHVEAQLIYNAVQEQGGLAQVSMWCCQDIV